DRGLGGPKRVGSLEGAAHSSLVDDGEHVGVDELCDVPIEARRRGVTQFGLQFGRRKRPVAEGRLQDPQPDRVQENICARHFIIILDIVLEYERTYSKAQWLVDDVHLRRGALPER